MKRKIIYKSDISTEKYVFLDRDGVIIEDLHHIKDPKRVRLIDGADTFFKHANNNKIGVIIITNQSGISRNLFTWKEYEQVTNAMLELIGSKNSILGIYANGYKNQIDMTLNSKSEGWRKPGYGMIKQACIDFNIEIEKAVLVGDRITDLIAGIHAGMKKCFHVKSGKGIHEREQVDDLIVQCKREKRNCEIIKIDCVGDIAK